MATLTGSTIAGSYKDLLKIAESSKQAGLDGTLRAVEDGDATASALYLATDSVLISGNATKLYFYDADGDEYISADNAGNLTLAAGVDLNLTAATDINIPVNVGLRFGDGGENIETDNTDFTITSGNDIVFALGATGSVYHTGDGGSLNTIYGYQAGDALASGGNNNVLIGNIAGTDLTTGGDNVAIGYQALRRATTRADENIAIGRDSMGGDFTIADVNGCVAVGYDTLSGTLESTAVGTIAIGYQAGKAITSGAGNTAIGYQALKTNIDGDNNTAVGYEALETFEAASDGDGANTAVGWNALKLSDDGQYNTAIGASSMDAILGGVSNVAIGSTALGAANRDESFNVAIGANAMADWQEGSDGGDVDYNIAIGLNAFLGGNIGSSSVDQLGNIAIGAFVMDSSAMANAANTGIVGIGHQALSALSSGAGNTAVGYKSGLLNTTGTTNTYIGHGAADETHVDASANTVLGADAFGGTHTGTVCSYNVAIGANTLIGAMNGVDGAVAVGKSALQSLTTGTENTAVGYQALLGHSGGDKCTAIGYQAMYDTDASTVKDSDNNIAIGYRAMSGTWLTAKSEGNTCIGNLAMAGAMNDAGANTAVGQTALTAITEGDNNTAIGYAAGDGLTTGSSNVAIGSDALGGVVTGDFNIAIGQAAGGAVVGGTENVMIGHDTGDNITTGVSNVCIGGSTDPSANDGTNQIVIGYNISGAGNDTFRVGKASNYISTGTFSGTDTFTVSSDKRKKRNINDNTLGLEFINDMKTKTFKWKPASEFPEEWEAWTEDADGNRVYDEMDIDMLRYGLIAQEVKESMVKFDADSFPGWNVDPKGIQEVSKESFVIPLIKAIQELTAKVKALEDAQ